MAYYNNFEQYLDNVAVISEDGEQISYAQLRDVCQEFRKNIGKRCLVFAFCENNLGSLCGYVSFLNNGTVPLLLKSDIEEELRKRLIELYHPQYLYIPEDRRSSYPEYECVQKCYGYLLLSTGYISQVELYSDLALLLTTSGSTGSPKLVRQSYKNIQANAESIVKYLELNASERPITTLPMSYTYGLSIINSHLLVGATILITTATLMQREFWSFFKEAGATSFGGVPYTYEILKKLHFFRMDLPCLKTMTQAGGKLSPELHKEFAQYAENTGKRLFVMYGQTEATARMAYLPHDKALEKYGSMGIAIDGGKLSLIDIEGNEIVTPDTVGELIYEGPNVTLGYAESENDLAKGDEHQGKLITGDMAKRDVEGFFYIVGRKKRFLKIYGNRVNLDEIEQMIKREFQEIDCASTGVDDKMYIFVTSTIENVIDNIKGYLALKTGLHPKAFVVKVIDRIPKNEAGKTLYGKLEEYYD